ncbi:hypothetical protein LC55x_4027 [Lysobacter capsici]|nr:hypothetical protein LC55x_4027 [Lysobacter capsici]
MQGVIESIRNRFLRGVGERLPDSGRGRSPGIRSRCGCRRERSRIESAATEAKRSRTGASGYRRGTAGGGAASGGRRSESMRRYPAGQKQRQATR